MAGLLTLHWHILCACEDKSCTTFLCISEGELRELLMQFNVNLTLRRVDSCDTQPLDKQDV